MKKNHVLRAEIIIIVALLLAILLPQVIGTTTTDKKQSESATVTSLDDIDGLTFVTYAGSIFEGYIDEYFPSSERVYVNDWAQMLLSISQGKADALLIEESQLPEIFDNNEDLTAFPIPVCSVTENFAAAKTEKGAEIVSLFNEYLSIVSSDGTLDNIFDKWADPDTAPLHVDIPEFTGERGTIRIGMSLDWSPYAYETSEGPCGSFIDLAYQFCAWAGYIPEFEFTDFTGVLAGLSTGKYDFFPSGVTYSKERAEEMYFTDPLFGEDVYVIMRSESIGITTINSTPETFKEENISVAILTGSGVEPAVKELYPDAEIVYFDTLGEIYKAVSAGKVELGMSYPDNLESIMDSFENIAFLCGSLTEINNAFAMQKNEDGEKLRDDYNEFVNTIKANGTYDSIISKWEGDDETVKHMGEYSYTGENGTLRIGTSGTWYPKSYYVGDELSGELVELVCAFCAEYGYTPEFHVMPYVSTLTGLLAGELDFAADGVTVTAERSEMLNFSEPFLTTIAKLVTKVENSDGVQVSKFSVFIENIKSSFEKNFIREGRWKMLLSGLGVTVALAVCAGIFGTLLGALICAMRMSRNDYLSGFARIYIKLIQGTPIVVLLLVLYYVVFGNSDISAFIVCVFGFSLDFAAYTSEIFRSGITAVPDGQRMAARALGFSRSKAFTKVVLPQAIIHILPVFSGQFIAMVKMTSVAGYISVQDLTKVSDIIRSRTYEAFFPLISTAIIYFAVSALLISVLKFAERKIDPALRPRKLKGVKTNAD